MPKSLLVLAGGGGVVYLMYRVWRSRQRLADDYQLAACCEGPRQWYVESDLELRKAFAKEQIEAVCQGTIAYLQYDGDSSSHKYEEGVLVVGSTAPQAELWRARAGPAADLPHVQLLDLLSTRPLVVDFGSFS